MKEGNTASMFKNKINYILANNKENKKKIHITKGPDSTVIVVNKNTNRSFVHGVDQSMNKITGSARGSIPLLLQ
jgi:hypothetical protein